MVFVILAATGGMPIAINTGNEINVPPPAIALTNPAASAARKANIRLYKSIMRSD
jgi:hypothetical protein